MLLRSKSRVAIQLGILLVCTWSTHNALPITTNNENIEMKVTEFSDSDKFDKFLNGGSKLNEESKIQDSIKSSHDKDKLSSNEAIKVGEDSFDSIDGLKSKSHNKDYGKIENTGTSSLPSNAGKVDGANSKFDSPSQDDKLGKDRDSNGPTGSTAVQRDSSNRASKDRDISGEKSHNTSQDTYSKAIINEPNENVNAVNDPKFKSPGGNSGEIKHTIAPSKVGKVSTVNSVDNVNLISNSPTPNDKLEDRQPIISSPSSNTTGHSTSSSTQNRFEDVSKTKSAFEKEQKAPTNGITESGKENTSNIFKVNQNMDKSSIGKSNGDGIDQLGKPITDMTYKSSSGGAAENNQNHDRDFSGGYHNDIEHNTEMTYKSSSGGAAENNQNHDRNFSGGYHDDVYFDSQPPLSDQHFVPVPPDDRSSHFFSYLMVMITCAVLGYLLFHNKKRIIALIIEGRRTRSSRSSRVSYHKLDNNLEEALGSNRREAFSPKNY